MTKISHKQGKGYVVEEKGQTFYFKTIQEAMAKGLEIDNKKKKKGWHFYNIAAIIKVYRGEIPHNPKDKWLLTKRI